MGIALNIWSSWSLPYWQRVRVIHGPRTNAGYRRTLTASLNRLVWL